MRLGHHRTVVIYLVVIMAGLAAAKALMAHGGEARLVKLMPWQQDHIPRVLAAGRSELGVRGSDRRIEMITIGDRSCVVGPVIAFDVDDDYAFDIDEPVDLTLTYVPELSAPFTVGWDQNGGEGVGVSERIEPQPGAMFRSLTLTLDRARLAGQGIRHADIAVGGQGGIVLCDVEIARSGSTVPASAFGRLRLTVTDASSERPIPARVGVYDSTGRAPLPSDEALLVHRFTDEVRLVWIHGKTLWPSANRQAFYVNGDYEARLPVGSYELVLTRGPEYRVAHSSFEVRENSTSKVDVAMERYADLPALGWFSGDSHVHIQRHRVDDEAVWGQLAAEDVHVANLLEMGNIAGTHFKQPAWGEEGHFGRDSYMLVSGQEDPRTVQRGHTIHHNLYRPFHQDPDSYFLYHRVFEESHRQGGISGYAHLGELFNGRRGLALDVPFGIVDFIEVLQGGQLFGDIWYSFLNLGFKVLPVAGADFPYFGPTLPGVERTYVKLDGPFSVDAFFDAFRRGRVFVSNGPFLEFTVNGHEIGEELRVEPGARLEIVAEASLNPDVDQLDRLELLVHGEVVASEAAGGRDRVRLRTEITADRSMWLAVRALGQRQERRNSIIAHSAPTMVIVDDEPFWKPEAVPELVARHRAQLQDLMTARIAPEDDLEPWETRYLLLQQWERQRALLESRVEEADARYLDLLERVQASSRR